MATHDLLVLNNQTSNNSKTYEEAFSKMLALKNTGIYGYEHEQTFEFGFEIGFWSAVEAITGYKSETDRS